MKIGDLVIYVEHSSSHEEYDREHFTEGKVYTLLRSDTVDTFEVIGDTGGYTTVYLDQIKPVTPNNALSKMLYPNYEETTCKKYLTPQEIK